MEDDGDFEQYRRDTGFGDRDDDRTREDRRSAEPPSRKRKHPAADEGGSKEKKPQENRGIYVENIPLDATVEEIEEVFKRYGLIDVGIDGRPRIKMYTDDDDKFNGNALIVYFQPTSVNMAITILDDMEFRIGDQKSKKMRITAADMSYKKTKDREQFQKTIGRGDRKAAERHRAELNRQLEEWSDNEEEVRQKYAPVRNKHNRTVIIRNAFDLEMLEDPDVLASIKEDMYRAGGKYGEVSSVTVYDEERAGIVTVKFADYEAAENFCDRYNGWLYNEEAIFTELAQDRPKFKKSNKEDEARMRRLARDDDDRMDDD